MWTLHNKEMAWWYLPVTHVFSFVGRLCVPETIWKYIPIVYLVYKSLNLIFSQLDGLS